jgi:hypothetical protein
MKKIKWTIMTLAILFSIGGAFASRPHTLQPGIYYWTGSGYMPAGTIGVTYVCEASTNICTYSYANGVYTPYSVRSSYTPIALTTTKPAPKKSK